MPIVAALAFALAAVGCNSGGSSGGPGNGSGGDAQGNAGSGGPGTAGTSGGSGGKSGNPDGSAPGGATGGGGVGMGAGGAPLGGAAGFGIGYGGSSGTATCMDPIAVTGGTAATVAVNLGMTKSTVGPDLMGIYTAVYDSNLQNPTTPSWLKAVGVVNLRYPGGSYSDLYHWSTGMGTNFLAGTANVVQTTVTAGSDFGQFVGLLGRVGAHAMITVNYGSNIAGNGPGSPQDAAAWVAYANGSPTNTTAIGTDAGGTDWKTVGFWAGLRAATPLATDDGYNFLRIGRSAPVGVKYWEIGNELYGNGFYYGGNGWEEDLHLAHDGTNRLGNANLSPTMYGMTVKAFSTAMKAVDPTIKIGAIVHWPYTEYASWNSLVLAQACGSFDFGINHWYAGMTVTDLLTHPSKDIPMMFSQLHQTVGAATGCPQNIPIAVTEWGPNYLNFMITPPTDTQSIGIFAANSYAYFMEQNALAVHWLELHADSFLGTTGVDAPAWAYNGTLMASLLAVAGDTMATATVSNAGSLMTLLEAHAAKHADGGTAVMLVNNSPDTAATVTVNVSGLPSGKSLSCVGTRYGYEPQPGNADGTPTQAPIYSKNNSVTVSVPAHAVVDVVFPAS
jgi:alpha-L-arabinofuranosidase